MIQVGNRLFTKPCYQIGDRVWFQRDISRLALGPSQPPPAKATVVGVNLLNQGRAGAYRVWCDEDVNYGGVVNGHDARATDLRPLDAVDQLGDLTVGQR